MFLFVFSVLLALSVSATCSLLEACLLSYTPTQVAELSQRHPRMGQIWQRFKDDIQRPIAVILIVNTAAHTIGATVAGGKFEEVFIQGYGWSENSLMAFGVLFTFLMLAFTEILPKTLGVAYNQVLAPVVAYPLETTIKLSSPLLVLVRWINRPFEPGAEHKQPSATISELVTLAGLARLSNLIGRQQEEIIKSASTLSEIRVRDIMVPVDQVTFMSAEQSPDDAIMAAYGDPHTRFPVCEAGDPDRLCGYVNLKELVFRARFNPDQRSIRPAVRELHYLDPDADCAAALKTFVNEHIHIAIVREEGRSLGLVTLEDLVEELVGEITDEFDRAPRMFHALSANRWMVGGGVPVNQLAMRLGVALPDAQGSVSRWLIDRLGGLPASKTIYEEAGLQFHVRRVRRGSIFEVAVEKVEPPPGTPPS